MDYLDGLSDEERRLLLAPMNIDNSSIMRAQMASKGYRIQAQKAQRDALVGLMARKHNERKQDASARAVIRSARAALGPDLGGHSVLDLLADNAIGSLDELRAVLVRIGEAVDVSRLQPLRDFLDLPTIEELEMDQCSACSAMAETFYSRGARLCASCLPAPTVAERGAW